MKYYDFVYDVLEQMIVSNRAFREALEQRDKERQEEEERRRRIEFEKLEKEARKKKRERRQLRDQERAAWNLVSKFWKRRLRPQNDQKQRKKKRKKGRNRQPATKPRKRSRIWSREQPGIDITKQNTRRRKQSRKHREIEIKIIVKKLPQRGEIGRTITNNGIRNCKKAERTTGEAFLFRSESESKTALWFAIRGAVIWSRNQDLAGVVEIGIGRSRHGWRRKRRRRRTSGGGETHGWRRRRCHGWMRRKLKA